MNEPILLVEILGWMSVINITVLCLATLALIWAGEGISRLHGSLFAMQSADLKIMYLNYLAHYKVLIFIFNLVPYLVLKLLY